GKTHYDLWLEGGRATLVASQRRKKCGNQESKSGLAAGAGAGNLALNEVSHTGAGVFERAFLPPTDDLRRVFTHHDVMVDVPDGRFAAGDLCPVTMALNAQGGRLTRLLGV